ncbi:voltage-dependent anion channel, partial [Hysterangium stoloniferum]
IHRNFTPAWFSVNMGTGVISALFHGFPYGGDTRIMNAVALAFFLLNLLLFILFLGLTIARCIMFPHLWGLMLRHPVQSLYFGCFPMGAVTLVTAGLTVVNQYWAFGGTRFLYILWGFWWLDAAISFLCCFGVLYIMTVGHEHSMSTLTGLWLLPVVTLIVASTTGQLFVAALSTIHAPHAFLTMAVSMVMLIIGGSISLMILTFYLRRLLIDGLPNVRAILSCFIPLGPCGQIGYSLLLAGQNFKAAFPYGSGNVLGEPHAGSILNILCFSCAFIMWCMGVWWLVCAIIAIIHNAVRGEKMPFTLSFWALVFPNGVQALLTIELGRAMDADFFRVLGAIYAATVILLWCLLAVPTLIQAYDRRLFMAPHVESSQEGKKCSVLTNSHS